METKFDRAYSFAASRFPEKSAAGSWKVRGSERSSFNGADSAKDLIRSMCRAMTSMSRGFEK